MRALKVVCALAVAAALIALVVTGIHAFYPGPTYGSVHAVVHARNIFLIALLLGLMFAVVGTLIQRRTNIIGAGLIVGGIGTMMYAVTPYESRIATFIGIAVILAVLIFVGYRFDFFSSLRRS
jgi:hypothetical protein